MNTAHLPKFNILKSEREYLYKKFVQEDNIPLDQAVNGDYDIIFLKNRFRNYSRLREKSLDYYYFQQILSAHQQNDVYIIDTDAQIKVPHKNLITFFLDEYPYPKGTTNIYKVIPVLKDDVLSCIRENKKKTQLTFIGNEYFKSDLKDVLISLKEYYPELKINVQGKWKPDANLNIIDRTKRILGYRMLQSSISSIHISKDIYLKYLFLSPRIFESMILGTIIFARETFMPKFSHFESPLELSEKLKFLNEISLREYYDILKMEINELYENVEEKIYC
ncbi:MAG: hypothetical protein ACTSYD_02240 [Candidatus Heimdallarchaeaceae archaeon]